MVAGPTIVTLEVEAIRAGTLADNPINEMALDFFVRLRAPTASAAERTACTNWLAASPAHQAAWDEIEALWADLDQIDVSELVPGEVLRLRAKKMSGLSRRHFWRAAAAVVVGGAALWSASDRSLWADYRTGRGERRGVALPDGSQAMLGARSAISLDFNAERRGTTLHEGAGYFRVASGDDRPFVVSTDTLSVTTVDAAFEIRRSDTEQAVTLAEGRAEITGTDGARHSLAAGSMLRQIAGKLGPISNIPTDEIAAWRQDRIIFRRTPLGEVAAELERYRNGFLIVTDASLAAREVSGVFDSRRTDQALETIAATMSAKLLRVSDLVVLIQPVG